MLDIGRYLILIGFAIVLIGVLVYALARVGFRGLPGDISYQSDHVRVYFPIVTCLLLSALLTLGSLIWRWFSSR